MTLLMFRNILKPQLLFAMAQPKRPSHDIAAFREEFGRSKHIVVISGAGVSAESGIPTFRGPGGLWKQFRAQELATPQAFAKNPSLVWEFYHYRRDVVLSKQPNKAHIALVEAEKRLEAEGRKLVVVTQNVDELHRRAGTKHLIEIHGSLFRTRCTKCGDEQHNDDNPICEALRGRGAPDEPTRDVIPVDQLPKCASCGGLLRPGVVWFNESLDPDVWGNAQMEVSKADLLIVVGTSAIVYPTAMLAPSAASRGVSVAEFNVETTPSTEDFKYHFCGPAGEWLPRALEVSYQLAGSCSQ